MKNWFLSLEARERQFLIGGVAVLLVFMIYLGVWEPITTGMIKLEKTVSEERSTIQWLLRSSGEVRALRKTSGAKPRGLGNRSMLAVVDQSARSSGLGFALKRVEPEGNDAVKVWLEQASFDAMITWIGQLRKTYGVEVKTVTLERQETAGQVNSRVTLAQRPAQSAN